MKRRKKNTLISLVMSAALIFGMSGTAAFATEADYDPSEVSEMQEEEVSSAGVADEPAGESIQPVNEGDLESELTETFMADTDEGLETGDTEVSEYAAGGENEKEEAEEAEEIVETVEAEEPEEPEEAVETEEPEEAEEPVEIPEDIDEEETQTPDSGDETAEIVRTGVMYATVQEAVEAADFGDTVIMLADSVENVTVAKDRTVILDLDGYSLKGTGTGSVITVYGSLTMTDSTAPDNTTPDTVGKVTGGKANYGGGVYISDGGIFIMENGLITGNKATIDGGGIYVDDGDGSEVKNSFEMSGGVITDNSADERGGGVYIGSSDVMTMSDGAAIYGNLAKTAAADIYALGDDTVKLVEADEMELLPKDAGNVYDGWYMDTEGERYAYADTLEKADVSDPLESAEGLIAGCDMDVDYGISMLASKSTSSSNATMAYPSTSGRLQVIGTQLCDQYGNPVQLKGVSSHGLSWYPEYVNSSCMADLRSWGANVFRLAMYTAEYNGYCVGSSSNQTTLKNLIKTGVDAARDNDMYVIIDWHILSDSNPLTYQSQAKSFFTEMAKEFAGYNNVIYEICNEPNSGTSWSDIKSYANTIIPAIRKYDPNAVIIVGTPTWSQDVDVAAADPLTGYSNIMYSLHFYAATHKDDLRNKMTSAIDAGLPVFVSEYGICDSSGSGSIDESSANTWVSLMNQYGVSYVMWNMSNKDESSSILKSSVTKTSGFSKDDLSQSGKWLLNMLGGSVKGSSGSGTDIVKINGVWTYTVNGKANYSYTGLAKNSNGWYYIKNGVLDRSYTGFAINSNGKWYVENGKVTKKTNGLFKDTTGALGSSSYWYYVQNSKVQTGYTGFTTNSSGKWYVAKGVVNKKTNGVFKDTKGAIGSKNEWYYVVGSKVQTSFTGLANYKNDSGWWYITKGKVDRSYNGLAKNKNGWYYLTNGKVDRSYTGFAQNSNGKWYVTKGKLTRKDNTVLKDKTGAIGKKNEWYYVVGSKVQTSFTGLANYSNSSGWWYITKGKVDRSYNGLAKNKNGWYYLTNGKVNRSYTGLATNSNGTWYVKKGKVQKSFTGTVTINGKKYSVTKGKTA